MRYVDEFRNPQKAKALLREIEKLIARIDICRHRSLSLMEVCGGHTHTIFKFGVESRHIGESSADGDCRDMNDRLQRGVEHFHDRVEIAAGIKEIADLQGFEV